MGEHRYAGQEGGVSMATHQVAVWLENEGPLYQRAKEIALGAEVNGMAGDLAGWVEFMLYGRPLGDHTLNDEPEHDTRTVMDLKARIDRDDFRRIDWGFVRESLLAE